MQAPIARVESRCADPYRWLLWRRCGDAEAPPASDGSEPTLRERMARGEFGGPQGLRAGPRP